ncbi:MAG: polyphosphate kinase 2 [Planctomycetes bacterium]|nr:polyphosphate kinase 2 [Planctomycetota bacterium]
MGKHTESPSTQQDVIALNARTKLKGKVYDKEMKKLHVELVKMQTWVKAKGLKVVVIFEGRDAAGKGGTIKALTEAVSPRVFRTVALPAPNDRERTQFYLQRYVAHLPAAGEVVVFDRSWYNRAGVEKVMGFCTDEEYKEFLRTCSGWELALQHSGIILLKYWLEVSMEEQEARMKARIEDPRKTWKLSPMDIEAFRRWYDFSRARDAMFAATDIPHSPWFVVPSDDKKRARLNCIAHILSKVPYEDIKADKVKLPKRQKPDSYDEPDRVLNLVPQRW